MEQKLNKTRQIKSALEDELAILTQDKSALEQKLTAASQSLFAIEDELDKTRKDKLLLEQQLVDTVRSLNESEQSSKHAKESLEKRITFLEKALLDKEKERAALEERGIQTKLSLEQTLKVTEQSLKDKEEKNAELGREVVELTNALEMKNQELDSYEKEADQLQSVNESLRTEFEGLAQEKLALEQQLGLAELSISKKEAESASLAEQLKQSAALLEQNTQQLQARLTLLTTEVEEKDKELKAYKTQLEKLQHANKTLEGNVEQLTQDQAAIENNLKEVRDIKEFLEQRLIRITKSLDEKAGENLRLTSKLTQIASKNEELKNQLISTKSFLVYTQAQLEQMRRYGPDWEELFQKGEALQEQITELTDWPVTQTDAQTFIREGREQKELLIEREQQDDPFSYAIIAPKTIFIGEPFTVKIIAQDKSGKIVTNYSQIGQDVELSIPEIGKITPNKVAASAFKDGVAEIECVHEKDEEVMQPNQ